MVLCAVGLCKYPPRVLPHFPQYGGEGGGGEGGAGTFVSQNKQADTTYSRREVRVGERGEGSEKKRGDEGVRGSEVVRR